MSVVILKEPELTEFERTEQRLISWGYACRQNSSALGLPTLSGMSGIIARLRAETRLRRGVRRKKGQQLTAKGKESQSFIRPKLELVGDNFIVDKAISRLPKWAKKCIFRSYMYGQPDRNAAEELRMRIGEYAQRRRAAVEQVAFGLRQR